MIVTMKNKRLCERLGASLTDTVVDQSELENAKNKVLHKPSQELLEYYKKKSTRLEKEYENLSEMLENIKSICDLSSELQTELNLRNEEVSRLQQVISDLQIHLFREQEYSLNLSGENDKLKIQALEDKKKISALLMLTGASNVELLQLISGNSNGIVVEKKLPPKLQKLREMKANKIVLHKDKTLPVDELEVFDPQALILKNQSLASQLEHHICISRDKINVLLKDRELSHEERQIEKIRLQKQIDLLTKKVKQTENCLCETSSKLLEMIKNFEKERNNWMEEKDKHIKEIKILKEKQDEKYPSTTGYSISGVGCKRRTCTEAELIREHMLEKEQLAAAYQEQVAAMETEITTLKDRAQYCRKVFREKIDKMTEQIVYLKNKYEDLDRRRQLEAEGFRTDIRMLRERLKDLEKKLAKANLTNSNQASEQQLLVSAKNILNRAKELEKELNDVKCKISTAGVNES